MRRRMRPGGLGALLASLVVAISGSLVPARPALATSHNLTLEFPGKYDATAGPVFNRISPKFTPTSNPVVTITTTVAPAARPERHATASIAHLCRPRQMPLVTKRRGQSPPDHRLRPLSRVQALHRGRRPKPREVLRRVPRRRVSLVLASQALRLLAGRAVLRPERGAGIGTLLPMSHASGTCQGARRFERRSDLGPCVPRERVVEFAS
jgi:hypothetical protein